VRLLYSNSQIPWKLLLDKVNEFTKNLLSMFQVDITDLLTNKFQLMVQDTKVQTTVIDSWYYWEYELYIKLLNDKNKEEKEQQDKQDKEQQEKYGNMSNFNPSKILSNYNPSSLGGSSSSKFPRF